MAMGACGSGQPASRRCRHVPAAAAHGSLCAAGSGLFRPWQPAVGGMAARAPTHGTLGAQLARASRGTAARQMVVQRHDVGFMLDGILESAHLGGDLG